MADKGSVPTAPAASGGLARPRQQAPTWQADREATNCTKCKVAFSLFLRKHHCRHCGKIFCEDCSSKQCTIPQYEITKPVRVCDECFVVIKRTNFDFNILD
mmetsp:Transcript_44938/g.119582  ORF Transcript_44938/g.119582 Transcript_44938/m.119582 type:complete len:101 (+) Transcript_44938:3-305(+)